MQFLEYEKVSSIFFEASQGLLRNFKPGPGMMTQTVHAEKNHFMKLTLSINETPRSRPEYVKTQVFVTKDTVFTRLLAVLEC